MEVALPKVQVKLPAEDTNRLLEELILWEYVQQGIFPNAVNSLKVPCLCFTAHLPSPVTSQAFPDSHFPISYSLLSRTWLLGPNSRFFPAPSENHSNIRITWNQLFSQVHLINQNLQEYLWIKNQPRIHIFPARSCDTITSIQRIAALQGLLSTLNPGVYPLSLPCLPRKQGSNTKVLSGEGPGQEHRHRWEF